MYSLTEAHYFSDEGIAIGPPTVRELKEYIFSKRKIPTRRYTVSYNKSSLDEFMNELNISTTTHLQTKEEINNLENTTDIIIISSDDDEDSISENYINSDNDSFNVINLKPDSQDRNKTTSTCNNHFNSINIENKILVDNAEYNNGSFKSLYSRIPEDTKSQSFNNSDLKINNDVEIIDNTSTNLNNIASNYNAKSKSSRTINTLNLDLPNVVLNNCFPNTNSKNVNKNNESINLDKAVENDSNDNDQDFTNTYSEETANSDKSDLHFNDTLEEMNRFLQYGLDYTMSDESATETSESLNQSLHTNMKTPNKEKMLKETHIPVQKSKIAVKVNNKFDVVMNTPKIVKKSPINKQDTSTNDFKVPANPPRLVKHSPANNSRYKHITSPIAHYIKHSCSSPLVKNVHLTPSSVKQHRQVTLENKETTCQGSSAANTLPAVIYKPSKQKIISCEGKKTFVPQSIQRFFPTNAQVYEHKEKTKKISNVYEKLQNSDFSNVTECSLLNTSDNDVSVIVTKTAYN